MDFCRVFSSSFASVLVLGGASDSGGNALRVWRVVRDRLLCVLCLVFRGFCRFLS